MRVLINQLFRMREEWLKITAATHSITVYTLYYMILYYIMLNVAIVIAINWFELV